MLMAWLAWLAWLVRHAWRWALRARAGWRLRAVHRGWAGMAAEVGAVGVAAGPVVRRKADWGRGLGRFVAGLGENEAWFTAWAADGSWTNYPLVVDGAVVPGRTAALCPLACRLLAGVPGVRVAGFSRVRGGGRIEPHTDADAGLSHGRLAAHVCLAGVSRLRVGGRWHRQAPGRLIVFDPEQEHEVRNDGPAPRVLLYVNLQA